MARATFDAIVIGGGGSGLAAAVSAAESGLAVILLEKQPSLGGTTGLAVGSFTAGGTEIQRRAGIADDAAAHALDAGKFPPAELEARNNASLRAFFLERAAETLEWLAGLGLAFNGPNHEPPNRVPRMHNVVPNGRAYVAALHARFLALGGVVLCRARVEQLVREGARVVGVDAAVGGERRRFLARRGVVVAAGDYAADSERIGRYHRDAYRAVEAVNPHATGEGHSLIEQAGGRLVNMDIVYGPELRIPPRARRLFCHLLPKGRWAAAIGAQALARAPQALREAVLRRLEVSWLHPENALFEDGALLINDSGERFCDETRIPDRELAVAHEAGCSAYILLDGRLAERYRRWPHFVSTAPGIGYAYVQDYLRRRSDVAVEASTLEELAARRGLPAEVLARTVRMVNRTWQAGAADPFGRRARDQPLYGERWVLLGPVRAYFTTTEGGAAIDTCCRVLDEQGRPIEGLFAVGQTGLGGQVLWGHGLHIAWAMTSGRLVGRVLAGAVV
jgi:fumarate reductase flavoprotein subunit